jgi:lipid-binding SYLF domain-containing protein
MMTKCVRIVGAAFIVAAVVTTMVGVQPALAASAAELDRDATTALQQLYSTEAGAQELAARAKGMLIFPSVIKGGFIGGVQYGEGALRIGGRTASYYNIVAGSYGMQAGLQSFGYVMLFMTDSALSYFQNTAGFEVGVGPSIVVLDAGKAKTLTTTTAQSDVYAFIFGQQGLMAGLGVQGSKISKINP